MAIGDAVNGIGLVATALTFQPAAGVEVVITSFHGDYVVLSDINLTDGVISTARLASTSTIVNPGNTKVFITNARYMRLEGIAGGRAGFSGVETQ